MIFIAVGGEGSALCLRNVSARLRGLQLPMIREWRGAAAEQLIRDVFTGFCRRQRIDQPDDPNGVIEQSLFKVILFLQSRSRALLFQLNVER